MEPLCNLCSLKKNCTQRSTPGDTGVDVLVIIDRPTLIGVRNHAQDTMLVYIRNLCQKYAQKTGKTVKYTFGALCPTKSNKINALEFASCKPRLDWDIENIKPKVLLFLGNFDEFYWDEVPQDYFFFEWDGYDCIKAPNIFNPQESYKFDIYQLVELTVQKAFNGPGKFYKKTPDTSYIMCDENTEIPKTTLVTWDIETNHQLVPAKGAITVSGFRAGGRNYLIPYSCLYTDTMREQLRRLFNSAHTIVAANIGFEHSWFLYHLGIDVPYAKMYDVQLEEFARYRENGPFNLQFLARQYLDCEGWKEMVQDYSIVSGQLYTYLALDLVYTEEIFLAQNDLFRDIPSTIV